MEREISTAVDPSDPAKGNRTVYVLDAYYDADAHLDPLLLQAAIKRARKTVHRAMPDCRTKHLELHFDSAKERGLAKYDLQQAGCRFYCHEQCLE